MNTGSDIEVWIDCLIWYGLSNADAYLPALEEVFQEVDSNPYSVPYWPTLE